MPVHARKTAHDLIAKKKLTRTRARLIDRLILLVSHFCH